MFLLFFYCFFCSLSLFLPPPPLSPIYLVTSLWLLCSYAQRSLSVRPVYFMLSTRILILLFSHTTHKQRSRKRPQWNAMFLIYLTQTQEFLTDWSAMRGRKIERKKKKQKTANNLFWHMLIEMMFILHFQATMANFHESIIYLISVHFIFLHNIPFRDSTRSPDAISD